MSDHFTPEATRRALLKAMAGGAMAGPLLGLAHATRATPGLRGAWVRCA